MDAKSLQSILDAQARMQQEMQMQMFTEQQRMFAKLVSRMKGMVYGSHLTAPASPINVAEFAMNSLSTHLPEFVYDPDTSYTFEIWCNRDEDVISRDGAVIDKAAEARRHHIRSLHKPHSSEKSLRYR
ncbi:unnamed protein product [Haemonchus placei]|uniref:Flagellar basal body rod protein FlgB n=1 Tax=Haemonchus placei TaxID=6290 RepID=A0A0N4W4X9_HAEPC|nr:unnamed protein product [Haemonchus placei]